MFCFSSLRFSNGKTAMLLLEGPDADGGCLTPRRYAAYPAILMATNAALTPAHTKNFRRRTAVCAALRAACLSIACFRRVGRWGLPNSSVYRFTRLTLAPCLTSHSPKLCRYGCQRSYSARSSAARFDNKMCPASPQFITRSAVLMPPPATLTLSLTSTTRLTGPL